MSLRQAQRSLADLVSKCDGAHIQLPEDRLAARAAAVEAAIQSQKDGKISLHDAQDKLLQRFGLDPVWEQQLEETEAKRQRRRDASKKRAVSRGKGAAGATPASPTTGPFGMRLEVASQSPTVTNLSDAAANVAQQDAKATSNDQKQVHADSFKAITAQADAEKRFADPQSQPGWMSKCVVVSNDHRQGRQTHRRPSVGMKCAKKAKNARTLLLSAEPEGAKKQEQRQDESLLEEKALGKVVDESILPNAKCSPNLSDSEDANNKEAGLIELIDDLEEEEDDDLGSDEEFTL